MTVLLRRRVRVVMMNLISEAECFRVGRPIGSYSAGGLQSSYQSPQYYSQDQGHPAILGPLKLQDVGEGHVKTRIYEGRLVQGPLRGTPVIFKVYPGQQVGGIAADAMATNELNAHASLRQEGTVCQNIQLLLGGFETKTGEQWLASAITVYILLQTMLKLLVRKCQKSPNNFGILSRKI